MESQTCSGCHVSLPLHRFSKTGFGGLRSRCKDCRAIDQNPNRKKLVRRLVTDASHKCSLCQIVKTSDCFDVKRYAKVDVCRARCKECRHLESRKEEKIIAAKEWHQLHRERRNKAMREWTKANRERVTEYAREWTRENPHQAAWYGIRRRARAAETPFTITLEEFKRIMNTEFCPICNVSMLPKGKCSKEDKTSQSLDRIRPEVGYTADNCACICCRCNTIKSFGTADEHRRIADFIDAKTR